MKTNLKETKSNKVDPRVRDILLLLGAGTFLVASIVMPGLPIILKPILEEKRKKDEKEWKKFNLWRLKYILKRLQRQKMIEIVGGVIRVTEKGKKKILKFDLENLKLKEKRDGKWRLIIYDVSNLKKQQREIFRSFLKRLKFLQLQESVYLTPFVCDEEIEYLRQTFQIGTEVQVLKVVGLENEEVYKSYFGIN